MNTTFADEVAVRSKAGHFKNPATISLPTDGALTFPPTLLYGVLVICVLPFFLNLAGVDFGSHAKPFSLSEAATLSPGELLDAMFGRLSGAFTHALLEWSAFTVAFATVLLAFSHFATTGNITTPIIGLALFAAGCMDAFHTLAAARLITAVADNRDLIPFTWAVCRIFNALIMIAGVSLLMFRKSKSKSEASHRGNLRFIVIVSLVFGLIGYGIIDYCANSAILPQTQYPGQLITRPYDVIPLLLFLFCGLYLYPRFNRQNPSIFAKALVLSAVPEVVVEVHMAFGSSALFDNHFNIAHFLKVIAYLIPLLGLILDYIATYRMQSVNIAKLESAKWQLEEQAYDLNHLNRALSNSNKELEQFAFVASHDLQEPLRKVQAFGDRLESKYAQELGEKGLDYLSRMKKAANRMSILINDLLSFSRVGQDKGRFAETDLQNVVDDVLEALALKIEESRAEITVSDLPVIDADAAQLRQLLQNLIANALKFIQPDCPPKIEISANILEAEDSSGRLVPMCEIQVADHGIGFDAHYSERIFQVFQRLHQRSRFEGTGIGLALCRRIAERHGGSIKATGETGKGATFTVLLRATAVKSDIVG